VHIHESSDPQEIQQRALHGDGCDAAGKSARSALRATTQPRPERQ
jgi:hypothetical protein